MNGEKSSKESCKCPGENAALPADTTIEVDRLGGKAHPYMKESVAEEASEESVAREDDTTEEHSEEGRTLSDKA